MKLSSLKKTACSAKNNQQFSLCSGCLKWGIVDFLGNLLLFYNFLIYFVV